MLIAVDVSFVYLDQLPLAGALLQDYGSVVLLVYNQNPAPDCPPIIPSINEDGSDSEGVESVGDGVVPKPIEVV